MDVKANYQELRSPDQTAAEMVRIAKAYHTDLGDKARWNLPRFYCFVRGLEFRPDPPNVEHLARPAFTMRQEWPFRDCDDKSILIGSWCFANGIPFRFCASSSREDKVLHHVYVIAKIKGREVVIDATYPHNQLGAENFYTVRKDLTGDIMRQTLATMEGYEMGSLKSLMRKTKNLSKQVAKSPLAKAAISSLPGGAAAIQAIRAGYQAAKATGIAPQRSAVASIMDQAAAAPASIMDQAAAAPVESSRAVPGWVKPAAMLAAGAAVVYFATRNKK